ncbi:AcrR family transcriptional regulator [Flavobacterium sp. CG_23.5]|uniref:TetR/AcrR family transcriptional regulator n=1 Tax=Flavobacterium sp. CG_23.5 TaxID=2760708 RepID=UPI001AE3F856|nr:TetR/AcrR family transcriptional regulator [Flavobacterium sp. CG_23.5]MBP2284851.1 AcrR family transcriptional regulator [Flavobacterium sp. CG_23.5]
MSKAERTKQFIIEKTAPIFNAKGYMGTSMNDIMHATGLTKGSIYGNFENKDEVALAAFDHNFGAIVSYIRLKIEARPKMIDKLLVYTETYRNFLKLSFLKAGCPILNTSSEADDTHPMLRKKAVNALKLWQTSLEQYIEIGIKTNEIKATTNAAEFSAILMSLIEGAVMQAKVTGDSTVLNFTMDFLEKMIKELKA